MILKVSLGVFAQLGNFNSKFEISEFGSLFPKPLIREKTFRNEGLFFYPKKPKMRKFLAQDLAQDLAQFLAQEGRGNKKGSR